MEEEARHKVSAATWQELVSDSAWDFLIGVCIVPGILFICSLCLLQIVKELKERKCPFLDQNAMESYISYKHHTSPVLLRSHKQRAFSSFLNLSIHVSHSSDSLFLNGLTKGWETGLIFKAPRGSLGAEVSAGGFSGCSSFSGVFYQNNTNISLATCSPPRTPPVSWLKMRPHNQKDLLPGLLL